MSSSPSFTPATVSPRVGALLEEVGTILPSERLELFQQLAVRYPKEMVALEIEDPSAPEAPPSRRARMMFVLT